MNGQNWSPIRRVAGMLRAGHRNILTFQWTPELAGGKAEAAITQMEREGAVRVTLCGVEPTPAFASWFEELKRREDQPGPAYPTELQMVVGSTPEADPAKVAPPAKASVRKRYFPHLSKDRREAGQQMAARIKDFIDQSANGSVRLADVKRALHGYRHPEAWEEGLRLLRLHRNATVVDGIISPTWSGSDVLPDPYKPSGGTKRRKHRVQSKWFLRNRPLMDQGQHSGFEEDRDDDSDGDEAQEEAC